MKGKEIDIVRLLKKIAGRPEFEIIYLNSRLLDDLFENQFGGVTKLLQSIERTSEQALEAEAGVGLGGVVARLFLDLKACIKAEGKIGKKTKVVVEKDLTLQKKITLCEAALEDQGLIIENPASVASTQGKYLRLIDLPTFTLGKKEKLKASLGVAAAQVVLARWREDQALTPNSPQVVLATRQPFCIAAIVKVQPEVSGSTYIAYPPTAPDHRMMLGKLLNEEKGVTFLKTYWIIDSR
jgi:hypothetical protein